MSGNLVRSLWLKIHLYLGLVFGLPLVLIGLSGSLIVFGWQLDELLNSNLVRVDSSIVQERRPLADSLAAANSHLPTNATPIDWLKLPKHAHEALRFSYSVPPDRDGYEIFVNPYTAEIIGNRLWGDFQSCCSWHGPLMAVIYRFHDSFWLGELGQNIVGSIGLLMLLSLISGVILWWPNSKKWKTALVWKSNPSLQRRVFDIHKLAGIYPLTVMATLLFTGVYLNFPKQSKAMLNHFSTLTVEQDRFKSVHPEETAISLDHAIELATAQLPNKKLDSISLPISSDGVYIFSFFGGDEITESQPGYTLVLDQYTGAVLYKTEANLKTTGDQFHAWQFGLHSGQAFGLTGQLLVLFGGILPALLFVTGVIRWRQKAKVKKQKSP